MKKSVNEAKKSVIRSEKSVKQSKIMCQRTENSYQQIEKLFQQIEFMCVNGAKQNSQQVYVSTNRKSKLDHGWEFCLTFSPNKTNFRFSIGCYICSFRGVSLGHMLNDE